MERHSGTVKVPGPRERKALVGNRICRQVYGGEQSRLDQSALVFSKKFAEDSFDVLAQPIRNVAEWNGHA